jgi:hypothetical protein
MIPSKTEIVYLFKIICETKSLENLLKNSENGEGWARSLNKLVSTFQLLFGGARSREMKEKDLTIMSSKL